MLRNRLKAAAALACAALIPALSSSLLAEEKKLGWSDTAELSLVVTGGNAETQTLGFKNQLRRTWQEALLAVNAGGIRAESTIISRAVDMSGRELQDDATELTAEAYFLNGRYDRDITMRLFWHAGAGWERNRFAGIDNRYTFLGGLGSNWIDTEKVQWRTTYAATYTDQEDVATDPNVDDTFVGARLTSDYRLKIGSSSTFQDALVLDGNIDDSEDFRADWLNSLTVSISSHLALKVSLLILFDNQPSSILVDEVTLPFPPGTPTGNKALVELDETDTILTTSLVINY